MNNRNSFLFLVILSVVTLVGCERDATVPLPDVEAVQVLNCFVSPGETEVKVYLSSSYPVSSAGGFSWAYSPLQGAEITLSGPTGEVNLNYQPDLQLYSAQVFPDFFVPGGTYAILSEHPDFSTVTASTTLPSESATAGEILVDYLETIEFGSEVQQVRFRFDIIDPEPEVFNYYRVVFAETTDNFPFEDFTSNLGNAYADDEVAAEGRISMNERFYSGHDPEFGSFVTYQVHLIVANEDYARYHKTMDALSTTGGGPFAEPVIVYSNVQNGLGCFGGFIQIVYQIE